MNKLPIRFFLLLVLMLCSMSASAYEEFVEGSQINFWIDLETGTATAYIREDAHGEVIVPATINFEGTNYPVKTAGVCYNEGLIGVVLSEGIESLETGNDYAPNISYVVLPSTISQIDPYALKCHPIDIYCLAENVPHCEDSYFITLECTLHVPAGCAAKYAAADYWKEIQTIVEITDDFTMFPDCTNYEERIAAVYLSHLGIVEGVNGELLADEDITRAAVAKTTFYGIYKGASEVPAEIVSDKFPCVYDDLLNPETYYERAAKALLYLDYGDGVTPFDRDRLNFDALGTIKRVHMLKVLIEAFNLKNYGDNGENPFPNDPDVVSIAETNPRLMKYIRDAAMLGFITTANERFRPYDNCTRGEAFMMLYRIMRKEGIYLPIPDEGSFFYPLNVTSATVSQGLGLALGNFQHYTKTSFAIPGTVPLTFAHTYNSYNTTLPSVFYGAKKKNLTDVTYQPLGDGWSHNYHSFITVVGKFNSSAPSYGLRAIVHWGGGQMDVYLSNGSKLVPESNGVYDDFTLEGSDAVITTKQQVKFRFSKVDTDDAVAVLYLVSITDRNGNTLTIDYEDGVEGGQRIKSVTGEGRSLSFAYLDGTDLLSEVSDPLGRKVTFAYTLNPLSDKLQLTSFTDAEGNTTTYEYNGVNNGYTANVMWSKLLTRIQLPKGNYIQNYYDGYCRLASTENGLNGVPTSRTSIGIYTSYAPNLNSEFGWFDNSFMESIVKVERNGETSTYLYNINENNVPIQIRKPDDDMATIAYEDYKHPELPTTIQQSTNGRNVSFQYDTKGNVTGYQSAGGHKWAVMTYDNMNNLKTLTDPNGNVTTYNYDEKGNLREVLAPEDVKVGITVNEKGLPTEVVNPMGVKKNYEYNGFGNLVKTTVPILGVSTSAAYDDASRLTSIADALGHTSSFVYNNNDFLTSDVDAMNHKTRYTYDANDNLTSITNAKNGVTTLTYDNTTDRLTSVEFGGATKQYAYNNDGTIKAFTKPDGTTLNYSYNQCGLITSDGVNQYSYTTDNLLRTVSGSGRQIEFSYDEANRIGSIYYDNDWYSSIQFGYDDNGNCISINNTEYSYDGLNRLTRLYAWIDNASVDVCYTYRKDCKLEKVEYKRWWGSQLTTEYGYDEAGRLKSKTTKMKTYGGGDDETILAAYEVELDKVGNIIQQTTLVEPFDPIEMTSEDITYTYNDANRITKAGNMTFEFDANGNTTKRGDEVYVWDVKNRLVKAGDTAITYDPLGLIASYGDISFKTNPVGMGNVISDSEGSKYIYGNGLEARVKDGVVSYYVTDLRGSVVAIVNAEGTVTHKYQYDEFGKVTQKEEADYNPFQYVGKYGVMCLNDHLYYMRARHYDPTIGRFLSEDPIWSTNLYPYANNNPIMGIDPKGESMKYQYEGITGYIAYDEEGKSRIYFRDAAGNEGISLDNSHIEKEITNVLTASSKMYIKSKEANDMGMMDALKLIFSYYGAYKVYDNEGNEVPYTWYAMTTDDVDRSVEERARRVVIDNFVYGDGNRDYIDYGEKFFGPREITPWTYNDYINGNCLKTGKDWNWTPD